MFTFSGFRVYFLKNKVIAENDKVRIVFPNLESMIKTLVTL